MAEENKSKNTKKVGKKEIKKKIVELAEKGITAEKIGLKLKKQGIDNKKIKIGKVLKENDLWKDPEVKNINEKVEKLKEHFKDNPHDYPSKQSLIEKSAYLRKIKK